MQNKARILYGLVKSTLISSGESLTRGVPSGGPSYTRLWNPGRKMHRKKAPICHPGLNMPPGHMASGIAMGRGLSLHELSTAGLSALGIPGGKSILIEGAPGGTGGVVREGAAVMYTLLSSPTPKMDPPVRGRTRRSSVSLIATWLKERFLDESCPCRPDMSMLDGDTLIEDGTALPNFRLGAVEEGRACCPGFQSSDPDMAPRNGSVQRARYTLYKDDLKLQTREIMHMFKRVEVRK